MTANELIRYIKEQYDGEQELMAVIYDSSIKEMPAGTWTRAVNMWDSYQTMWEVDEYVDRLIADAMRAEQAELAIDSFLEQTRLEEIENA